MKKYILLLLFCLLNVFQAQEITGTKDFKKCKKNFSKKICLSDEDSDTILFYLDKCPKENGPSENFGCPFPDTDGDGILDKDDACIQQKGEAENNGCPWWDTDHDGILDKDDACPTLPGVPEENGCPKRDDCVEYFKNERNKLANFKEKNKAEKEKFIALRKIVFDNLPKDFLVGQNLFVSIYVNTFINDNISFMCSSRSTLNHDQNLFLDQLFWTKDTFEYISKKFNQNIIPTIGSIGSRQSVNKSFVTEFKNEGYYQFIQDFPELTDINNRPAFYYSKNKQKVNFNASIPKIVVNFALYDSKNQVNVEFYKASNYLIYTYEYVDNQWKLIKKNRQY